MAKRVQGKKFFVRQITVLQAFIVGGTAVLAISSLVHMLYSSRITTQYNEVASRIIDNNRSAANAIVGDLRAAISVLGDCDLRALVTVQKGDPETPFLEILAADNRDVSVIHRGKELFPTNISIRRGKSFLPNTKANICAGFEVVDIDIKAIRATHSLPGLQWVETEQVVDYLVHSAETALLINPSAIRYYIIEKNGDSVLLRQINDGDRFIVARSVQQPTLKFHDANGQSSDSFDVGMNLVGMSIEVTTTPRRLDQEFAQDYDELAAMTATYGVPVVGLGRVPYPYQVGIKLSDREDLLDKVIFKTIQ